MNPIIQNGWSKAVKVYLREKGKLQFLSNEPFPDDSKDNDQWHTKKSIIMTWLWNGMEPSVTVSITFFNTAKQTWEALQEKCP